MDALAPLLRADRLFFTRAEALAHGESDESLRAALRLGLIDRLRHGVYARTASLASLDAKERHLLLARAAVSQQRGPVALAGPTAALEHDYDVFGHDLGIVHLARLDGGAARRETGIVHHQISEAVRAEVVSRHGMLVVSPADAVWQTALMSSLEGAVVTADSALHRDVSIADDLRRVAGRTQVQPGSRTARLALRLARSKAESVGESLTRVACFRHGIPEPALQHPVVAPSGELLGRADFYWEEQRLLGEFDGRVKYERLLREGETSSRAVVREKRREDDMRATQRGMSRFVWSEVQPGSAARRMARLAYELEQSRRLYVRSTA